jgi:Phage integrase family/Transposase
VRAIGLDVHRDFCEVAIAEQGKVRSAGRIATRPEVIELFAQSLACDDRVVLEVTGNAWEIARIIEPHVARVVVVSPSDTGIRHARAKTDRLDARTLAKLLAAGTLDSVWMPDERTRVMRRRLARRSLRHTFGTRMAAAGVPMRTLQEWMGHRDLATTQIYADYAPSAREVEMVAAAFARGSNRGSNLSESQAI